jgi:hypothetical protein
MSSSRLRDLRAEDAEQVAALFVRTFGESRKLDAEEVRSWLRNTELRPEWLRVLDDRGAAVVGDVDIWPKDDALDVDAQNVSGALRLYERVGMRQVGRSEQPAEGRLSAAAAATGRAPLPV